MSSSVRKAVLAVSVVTSMSLWMVAGCGVGGAADRDPLGQVVQGLSKNCQTLCKCLDGCDMQGFDVACFKACFAAAEPTLGDCMCLGLVPPDDGSSPPSDGSSGGGGNSAGGGLSVTSK